ncbi:MAG: Sua5/YciO/YrdC/YwlC family protein [Proteobacteria bacterium]|nr:Sua5/YciO/YrdC/YwlC family protein [Pseudomonadota bacterium]
MKELSELAALGFVAQAHQLEESVNHVARHAADSLFLGQGLILIASSNAQLEGWMTLPPGQLLPDVDSAKPVTWIVPPGNKVIPLLHGDNSEIAVRLTANPIARSICDAVDAPLVSTSANLSGRPVARNRFVLRRQFLSLVDYLVPGDCGPASGPSEIRHLLTGQVLRPRQS